MDMDEKTFQVLLPEIAAPSSKSCVLVRPSPQSGVLHNEIVRESFAPSNKKKTLQIGIVL